MQQSATMTFDFTVTDLKRHFTIDAAAIAWLEIDNLEDFKKLQYIQMRSALLQAVQDEVIKAQIPRKIVEKKIGASLYDMEEPDYQRASILREDLKAWAESKNMKPKFLFPEERVIDVEDGPEKEGSLRKARITQEKCKVAAQILWSINPQHKITELISHPYIQNIAGGNMYTAKVIRKWLSEVDPRSPTQKKSPFSKNSNK